jgi:hypothetical protein
MKHLIVVALVAGCGGSAPKPQPPDPAPPPQPVTAVESTGEQPRPPTPEPDPPPPDAADDPPPTRPDPATLLTRVRTPDGPLAGMPAFAISHRANKNVCGGEELRIARVKKTSIDKNDELFARVLELSSPTGLDFGEKKKKKSREKFDAWLAYVQERGKAAADHYRSQIAPGDAAKAVAAAARISQLMRVLSERLVRFEIPVDARAFPEAASAFCDAMREHAEVLAAHADDARAACAAKASLAGAGWWTTVCTEATP